MDSQHEFKMPSIIPQDLRLIQDLIGDEIPKPPPVNTTALATAIPIEIKSDEDSSDDEDDSDSEKEVEANILADLDDEEDADQKSVPDTSFFSRLLNKSQNRLPPSESTSDSESMDTSSDSDSSGDENEDKDKPQGRPSKNEPLGLDEDEESGPAITSESQLRTKNEIAEFDVAIPDIEEVPPDEQLEKVGEVMSIIDKVVIVKGAPSTLAHRGSERALDSDTLLVFEDRKVLGFVSVLSLTVFHFFYFLTFASTDI